MAKSIQRNTGNTHHYDLFGIRHNTFQSANDAPGGVAGISVGHLTEARQIAAAVSPTINNAGLRQPRLSNHEGPTLVPAESDVKIGLEIHCQLTNVQSKLFCLCSSDYRGKAPNSSICPICCGLPGALPLLNQKAVLFASMISLALNCTIPERIVFYRKNYFYPDLPKNFQLTQYNAYGISSIGIDGYLEYGMGKARARIRRVQLEEDPGRVVYESGDLQTSAYTLLDYNRAGVPLVEIVTEPDFTDPKQVRIFLNKLASVIDHLGVSSIHLEGAVRCDANVSVSSGHRVEIKNVGSFSEVEKALRYEIARQRTMVSRSIEVKLETRHWDDARKITKESRTKEEEQDYRYFPEPDIPAVILGNAFTKMIKAKIPELPDERKLRFIKEFGLSLHVSQVLIENKELADFFELAVSIYNSPKEISNWLVTDLMSFADILNERPSEIIQSNEKKANVPVQEKDISIKQQQKEKESNLPGAKAGQVHASQQQEKERVQKQAQNQDQKQLDLEHDGQGLKVVKPALQAATSLLSGLKIEAQHIAELARLVEQGTINRNTAKLILSQIVRTGEMPSAVAKKIGASNIQDSVELLQVIDAVFALEHAAVQDAKKNQNASNFLLGKVMQATKGRADPKIALALINKRLASIS